MQGKDNDVIIVSLVRSNPSSTIGFLSSINRLCVAISRARFALYLFGNSAALSSSSKKGWKVSEIGAFFSLLSRSSVSQSILYVDSLLKTVNNWTTLLKIFYLAELQF